MRNTTIAAFEALRTALENGTIEMTAQTVKTITGISETTIRRYAKETGIEIHSVWAFGWDNDDWYNVRTEKRVVSLVK